MEMFAAYTPALTALALFTILVMLMSPISSIKKQGEGLSAGGTPANAYDNSAYRWNRAYLNATENFGVFAGVMMAAILSGGDPWWVNLLAMVFLVARVLHAVIHVSGIGAENMGPRTFAYVAGWACCIGLAILVLL